MPAVEIDGDARLGEVALHGRGRRTTPGPSKRTSFCASVFDDVELAADRVHHHVEQDRADVRRRRAVCASVLASIANTSLVGQVEPDRVVPVAAELVLPVSGGVVELDDQRRPPAPARLDVRCSGRGCRRALRRAVRISVQRGWRVEAVADAPLVDVVVWLPEWKPAA